jgi:hypothetical protein
MILVDNSKRPTASDVLNHAWVQKDASTEQLPVNI